MDADAHDPWTAPVAPVSAAEVAGPDRPGDGAPPGPWRSAWRWGKTGVRLTSYVVGPIAAVVALAGLAVTLFGLGSGRGFGVHVLIPRAFTFYFAACLTVAVPAAAYGLAQSLGRRGRPVPSKKPWRAALGRSVRHGPRFLRRRWVWVALVGVPVGLVLTAALLAGVYAGRVVDRRLAEATAAADRDDPAWRLEDLINDRVAVPDSEDTAAVVWEARSFLPEH